MHQKPVTSSAKRRHVFHERTWRSLRIYVSAFTYICLGPHIYMSSRVSPVRQPPIWGWVEQTILPCTTKYYYLARPSTTSTCDQVLLPNAALWCEIKFHRAITIPPCTPICRAILYLKQKKLGFSLAESPNFSIFAAIMIWKSVTISHRYMAKDIAIADTSNLQSLIQFTMPEELKKRKKIWTLNR